MKQHRALRAKQSRVTQRRLKSSCHKRHKDTYWVMGKLGYEKYCRHCGKYLEHICYDEEMSY